MLYDEYSKAMREELASRGADNERVSEETLRRLYPLAARLYICRKLDSVCIGPRRHQSFARWFIQHQRLALRYQNYVNRRIWIRIHEASKNAAIANDRIDTLRSSLI